MAKIEKTSARVASKAAKALSSTATGARAKSLAGSALSQAKATKETSTKVASKAGKTLADGRANKSTKSLAGSALTQRPDKSRTGNVLMQSKKETAKTTRKMGSAAASALTQHVSTRRTADGRMVRVVLTPISSGSLKRDRVEAVVARVLSHRKK